MSAVRERSPARRELLRWCAGLGAVSAESLALSNGSGLRSARGRLAAAASDGTMRAWRLLRAEPALYTLTPAGMRVTGLNGLSPGRVSPGSARHAAASALAAAALEQAFPAHRVLGEPALRKAESERGRSFAPLDLRVGGAVAARLSGGAGSGRASHRPDLLLCAADAEAPPVAVEVELTVKSAERLAAICRAWARSREVGGVIYLASQEVLGPLRRAVAVAGAGERIALLELEALLERARWAPGDQRDRSHPSPWRTVAGDA